MDMNEKNDSLSFNKIFNKFFKEEIFILFVPVLFFSSSWFYVFVSKNAKNGVSLDTLIMSIVFFIISIVAITIAINFFIIKKIINAEKTLQMKNLLKENALFLAECEKCVNRKVTNNKFLSYFNLITFDELLQIESSLNNEKDEVIIYTSCSETEEIAKEVVMSNIKKGVSYNLLFYNGSVPYELKKSYKNVYKMPKNEKSFDWQLSNSTGFDLMLYKRYKNNEEKIEAYFCVNFSIGAGCPDDNPMGCQNPCNKNNEYLFYKKIGDQLAKTLYDNLSRIIKNRREGKSNGK